MLFACRGINFLLHIVHPVAVFQTPNIHANKQIGTPLFTFPLISTKTTQHDSQSEDMQQDAIDTASQAMEKFNIEKDIAAYIKKECAYARKPPWSRSLPARKRFF